MSSDGPCSVLQVGMHGLSFSNSNESRASSARDQMHFQQQLQQQHHQSQFQRTQGRFQLHQPPLSATLQAVTAATRRANSGARKENTQPMQQTTSALAASLGISAPQLAVSSSSRFGPGVGSGTGTGTGDSWDPDEPMPDVLGSPRLRSVSSLVLSSDGEDPSQPLAELVAGAPAARLRNGGPRALPTAPVVPTAEWTSTSNVSVRGLVDMLGRHLLPPTTSDAEEYLERQQSFPPPTNFALCGGRPGLVRDQSFPPANAVVPLDILPSAATTAGWPIPPMAATSSAGGVLDCGVLSGSGGGGVTAGPSSRDCPPRFVAGGEGLTSKHARGGIGGDEKWDVKLRGGRGGGRGDDGGSGGGGGGSGDDEDPLFKRVTTRPKRADRHASFDKLLAMIPGMPPQLHSPSSSPAPASEANGAIGGSIQARSPAVPSTPPTRNTPRQTRGREGPRTPKQKRAHDESPQSRTVANRGGRASGGARSSRKANKQPKRPVSCAPSAEGEPVDLAKEERRKAVIGRYMYKRSRRKFADLTREASPSRSRPKAARIRPRLHGKFIKTGRDFVPVTAVAQEVDTEEDIIMETPGASADGHGLSEGGGEQHAGVKEVWAPLADGSRPFASYHELDGSDDGVPPSVVSDEMAGGMLWPLPSPREV